MSCRERGPLHRSNSMATADGTPPEFHWWTARVPANLAYPSSTGSTRASSPVETRRTTNRQIDVPAEHHVRSNITLKPGKVSKNRDATGRQDFAKWCETCMCLHVDITDDVTPVNFQYLMLTFHVEGLETLSCLLLDLKHLTTTLPLRWSNTTVQIHFKTTNMNEINILLTVLITTYVLCERC